MKILCLRLPEPIATRLAAVARKKGQSRSAVVRAILDASLAGGEATPEGSCMELAAELAGSLDAPADLSVDKKHLRGYGQ
jgi:plasmid stability protein